MARFTSLGEAGAARSALEAAGIETWLADENMIGVDWLAAQALHGIKLIARPEDIEEAREILRGGQAPALSAAEGPSPVLPDDEPPIRQARAPVLHKCSECGSTDLRPIPRFKLLLLVIGLFAVIGTIIDQMGLAMTAVAGLALALLITPSHRCASCGARSTPPPEERDEEPAPPDPSDTIETPCPRCGSLEVHNIPYRRLKAIPMLFNPAILVVFPIWLMKPKKRCDTCGLEIR